MKNLCLLLFALLITANSFGQAVLLVEDFSGAPQYTLLEMPEQIYSTTAYFTRTDGTNIASPINFTNGEPYFAAQDIDTAPMVSPATMLFDDIDISTYSNLTFGVALAEHDAGDGMEDWDDSDFVHFDYRIDNTGSWKNLVWVENDGSTFDSAPQIDTDFDGVGDGVVLINEWAEDVTFDIPDTGSVIDIRVTFGGLDSADEDIAIDVIYLGDNFNLFPSVDITSPTDNQVFLAGTTSVDITYTITNTPERVDIDVDGTLTSDIGTVGPFNVATVDGEIYNAQISLYAFGNFLVGEASVSFSVDPALGLDDNKSDDFIIYPNPTSLGFVNIKSGTSSTMKVVVFDILGKQIISSTVTNNKLDVSSLNVGMYIMRLTQNNASVIKKLVIN